MLNGDAPDAMMPSYHNAAVKTRPGFLPRGQGHGNALAKFWYAALKSSSCRAASILGWSFKVVPSVDTLW